MKKKTALLSVIFVLWGCGAEDQSLLESFKAGQSWIVSRQNETGLFDYQVDKTGQVIGTEDNLVRQVGVFWSLVESLKVNPSPEALASVDIFRKAIQDFLVTVEPADMAFLEFEGLGKINASALYVLALTSLVEQGYELSPAEALVLPKIIKGFQLMESEDGGFLYAYFVPQELNRVSVYGSGQVIYALLRYYRFIDSDPVILALAQRNLTVLTSDLLSDEFYSESVRAFSLWALYSLTEIKDEERLNQVLSKLLKGRERGGCRQKACFFYDDNREPAFLEGVIFSAPYWGVHHDLLLDYQSKALAQMTDSQRQFEGNVHLKGGFCRNEIACDSIRIDYVQHALMALVNQFN